jgi:hypothetical protein
MGSISSDYVTTTAKATLSFPSLHAPKTDQRGNAKYEATLLFAKNDPAAMAQLGILKGLAEHVIAQGCPDKTKRAGIKWGFKDGDQPNGNGNITAGFAGHWVVSCRTTQAPGCLDEDAKVLTSPEAIKAKFYSGCKVFAQVNAFWYSKDGNRGASFGLSHIQFAGHGERLGGSAPAPAFTAVPGAKGSTPAGTPAPTGDNPGDFMDGPSAPLDDEPPF